MCHLASMPEGGKSGRNDLLYGLTPTYCSLLFPRCATGVIWVQLGDCPLVTVVRLQSMLAHRCCRSSWPCRDVHDSRTAIVDQEATLCLLRPRLAPLVMVMSLTSAAERTVAVAELVCTCLASAVSVSVDLALAPVKISQRRTVQIWRPR